MITRILSKVVIDGCKDGFITVIYGPRRVGKTVLLEQIKAALPYPDILTFNGDTQETRDLLSTTSETKLSSIVKNQKIIFIDEAQRIKNIGLSLKILIDQFPDLKIIVTGSATLDLSKGVRETLTGRTITYRLFPLSMREIVPNDEQNRSQYLLPDVLLFGGYPYVQSLANPIDKQRYLEELAADYLLKDLLELKDVGDPDALRKLLSLLAYQIGNQVSLNELASQVSISTKTVARYLWLLEKVFVIFPLGTYSTNLRSEVARSKKYYFYDLGIRNALIRQFGTLDSRTDVGALWENFMMVERMKKHEYDRNPTSMFFWRDYAQNEIDLIEKNEQNITAFEFKWSARKRSKTPKFFKDAYAIHSQTIHPENFETFI